MILQPHAHWVWVLTMHCGKALEPLSVSITLLISGLEKNLKLEEERLKSANHGMVWIGRDIKNPKNVTPCHFPPPQASPSPVQPGFGRFQGFLTTSSRIYVSGFLILRAPGMVRCPFLWEEITFCWEHTFHPEIELRTVLSQQFVHFYLL